MGVGRGICKCDRNGIGRVKKRISGQKKRAKDQELKGATVFVGIGMEGASRGLIISDQKFRRRMDRT